MWSQIETYKFKQSSIQAIQSSIQSIFPKSEWVTVNIGIGLSYVLFKFAFKHGNEGALWVDEEGVYL